MTELAMDQLALLRAEVTAKQERKQNSVKAEVVAKIIFDFLNNVTLSFLAVEDVFSKTDLTHSAIVQRFSVQIAKYKLNELVQATNSGGHVYLVKMTDPPVNEDDEGNDDDEEIGVIVEAD